MGHNRKNIPGPGPSDRGGPGDHERIEKGLTEEESIHGARDSRQGENPRAKATGSKRGVHQNPTNDFLGSNSRVADVQSADSAHWIAKTPKTKEIPWYQDPCTGKRRIPQRTKALGTLLTQRIEQRTTGLKNSKEPKTSKL